MNSMIKKRAQERKLEREKAERAQQLATAFMTDADAGKAVDVPPYALLPSNAPSRASSVLGASGHVTEDGDESDHGK